MSAIVDEQGFILSVFRVLPDKEVAEAVRRLFLLYAHDLPKPRTIKVAKDQADHWGLSDPSMKRIADNMKALGYNELLEELTHLGSPKEEAQSN